MSEETRQLLIHSLQGAWLQMFNIVVALAGSQSRADYSSPPLIMYNYVVTAHKPSNVNLSVTGLRTALHCNFSHDAALGVSLS